MPVPFLSMYKQDAVKININITIIKSENGMETSLIPIIPSLNIFTTYSMGFASEIFLQNSGSIFIE